MKGGVVHAYLDYVIVAIQKQLTRIALLIEQMSGKCTSLIDSTRCINKTVLWSGSNVVDHINDEVLNSLYGKIKISADLYRISGKTHFPVEFQFMTNILLFFFPWVLLSRWLMVLGIYIHHKRLCQWLLNALEIHRRHIRKEFPQLWPAKVNGKLDILTN
jgi:hypothetical protein